MASGQKDKATETDAWGAQRPRGCDSGKRSKSAERFKQRVRQAESERGRQNYNRQERQRQRRPDLLLSCTLGMRQAPQGFFQLQEVFSMPYL